MTKTVGGVPCVVTQMPAEKALELEARLLPVIMHSIVPIVSYIRDRTIDQGEVLSNAIQALSKTLPPAEMADLIKTLLSDENLFIDGEKADFNKHFSGGKAAFFKYEVAAFILEANFADFIDALLASGALGLIKSKSETGESTGESGGPASPSLASVS